MTPGHRHPSSAPTSLSCLMCPRLWFPPNTPLSPDIQQCPCPFPQLLLPHGLVGNKQEEFLAPSQGRCPGRREAAHTHARDRSEFQLPRACWERAKRGQGGVGRPSSQKPRGQRGAWGRAMGGRSRRSEWPWSEPCRQTAHCLQCPDGKTEAPWCQTLSS